MLRTAIASTLAALAIANALPAFAASALAPLPAPAATADFGSVRVTRYGVTEGATPVVLLPCLACGPWEWNATIARLGTNRPIFAVSFAGMDGRPSGLAPLVPRTEEDLWNALARLHVETPVIMGHGLGGQLALDIAAQHPERIAGVISVDTLPVSPELATADYAQVRAEADRAREAVPKTAGAFARSRTANVRVNGIADPATADDAAAREATSDPASIAQWSAEAAALDLRPVLKRFARPVLAIVPVSGSDADEAARRATATAAFANAPRATIVTIRPAKSFAMIDAPEAFAAAIDTYLSSMP